MNRRLPVFHLLLEFHSMTAAVEKLLRDIESLALEEQLLVRQRLIRMTESVQRKALEQLRGASQGEHLLDKLLADRTRERERG